MLFNSYEYVILFLPISVIVYFILNKYKLCILAKAWLLVASLFFYSFWNVKYLPLIILSILFNFFIGRKLGQMAFDDSESPTKRYFSPKVLLTIGVAGNLLLLAYFKYMDFFIDNVNGLADWVLHSTGYFTSSGYKSLADNFANALKSFTTWAEPFAHVILPLGISFFTFTQIAYLVDAKNAQAKEYDLINYGLFVTFFPHLMAGPILHHKEMMPQFDRLRNKFIDSRNIAIGVSLFAIGLFKKIAIADEFALFANAGFNSGQLLGFLESWTASLSYSLQLYFDFSGYTDMALGSGLLMNIRLPANFRSPYKALNIQDFWTRWHITLSRFLRDYLYIPLGGNRLGNFKTYRNLILVFLIGGLWHGAGWNFVVWGALHGAATVVHRIWKNRGHVMPKWLAWFLTFNFVNFAFVFFRAPDLQTGWNIVKGMFGFGGFNIPYQWASFLHIDAKYASTTIMDHIGYGLIQALIMIPAFIVICLVFKHSDSIIDNFKPDWKRLVGTAIMLVYGLVYMSKTTQFLYFQF